MTGLFGWLPRDGGDPARVLTEMGCALQAHAAEGWAIHAGEGFGVGVLDGMTPARVGEWAAPVWSADGQHALWLAGEIYDAPGLPLDVPQDASTAPIRAAILGRLIARGPTALRDVDGEFLIAWWDRAARTMRVLSDRFGGLSCYWARTPEGVAFASGVRGVLMAPGVSAAPDLESVRDVTTFGGFRLGTHTNVAAVRMFPDALVATLTATSVEVDRHWQWTEMRERDDLTVDEAAETSVVLWREAMRRRLRGTGRAGLTLSGGLDSRLVLAESLKQGVPLTAITYGLPGSQDEHIARRVARTAKIDWRFLPLYGGDWLATRTDAIQQTDGLIQLVDMMHLESLPLQHQLFETHLSGYAGDAVAGPTFGAVHDPESALLAMPYYETAISRGWHGALARLESVTESRDLLGSRFLIFEHKRPQSTNRWSEAWRPWVRVRKPFMDHDFFDHAQSLSWDLRGRQRVYEVWLRRHYPELFARIPNHKTGAPVLASPLRLQRARAGRLARRVWMRAAWAAGLPHRPWRRSYFDDGMEWSVPDVQRRITETILRPGSLTCEVFGRAAVGQLLTDWFTREAAPAQVIGALYVYERYHADLGAHLASARHAGRARTAKDRRATT
ncbi:MAG: asparagine synthase-related protein [Vicinamibacterales bacterium]|nr:asparagine synthase-related protein [Vicinamibacterales bacterium]